MGERGPIEFGQYNVDTRPGYKTKANNRMINRNRIASAYLFQSRVVRFNPANNTHGEDVIEPSRLRQQAKNTLPHYHAVDFLVVGRTLLVIRIGTSFIGLADQRWPFVLV